MTRARILPLLLLLCAPLGAAACSSGPDGPNILLITLDTTRRDRLGFYGYDIPTSPRLDELARDSVVYTNAYAVSSWTLPTHASMFTGKLPSSHGASYDPEGPLKLSDGIGERFSGYRARPIAENQVTLAELLSEHGYSTAGIIAGPWMKKIFRLGRGFEHYDDEGVTALNGRPAEDVTDAAIAWLEDNDDGFFLFLNYYDPHSPWYTDPEVDDSGKLLRPPKPLQDLSPVLPPGFSPEKVDGPAFANLCYDAEIRYMDEHVGRLLDHLRAQGLYENTWIFVLSDHGELIGDACLGETGLWGHGNTLTQPEIHIPFLVKEPGPGARTGEDASPVLQTDILPTILRRLGIPLPSDIQGVPLGGKHPIVAELTKLPNMNVSHPDSPKDWRNRGDWTVFVDGTDKLGLSSNGTHFMVDLAADPLERTNVYANHPERAEQMQRAVEGYLKSLPPPGATGEVEQPSADELEALRGLGYIGETPSEH